MFEGNFGRSKYGRARKRRTVFPRKLRYAALLGLELVILLTKTNQRLLNARNKLPNYANLLARACSH